MLRSALTVLAVVSAFEPCLAQTSKTPDIQHLLDEAARNSPEAATQLGEIYEFGIGTPIDAAQARVWFEKAADAGYAPAMTEIGNLYERGYGVPKDDAKARAWWEKAAALGDARARQDLSKMSR